MMENNILKWILVLIRKKWAIIGTAFFGTLITYGICWLFPIWFRAEAVILPPYNQSTGITSVANLGGILGFGGSGGDFTLPIMKTQTDLWAALAENRAILDSVIVEKNLLAHYDIEAMMDAREKLAKHLEVEAPGEGLLKISIEAKTPEFSAELTNALVEQLDRTNRRIKIEAAKDMSLYLQERLNDTKSTLESYEDSLVAFQQKYGAISIEDQARVIIENAAQIESQMLITEVELGIAQKGYSSEHAKVKSLLARKMELQDKMSDIEYGEGDSAACLNIPLVDVPKLALKYSRLLRETTAREVLYTYLLQSYEQSMLEAQKDTPVMRVLATAVPPEEKSRPVRSVISVISGFIIFLLTCAYILIKYTILDMKEKSPEKYQQLAEIQDAVMPGRRKDK